MRCAAFSERRPPTAGHPAGRIFPNPDQADATDRIPANQLRAQAIRQDSFEAVGIDAEVDQRTTVDDALDRRNPYHALTPHNDDRQRQPTEVRTGAETVGWAARRQQPHRT
jgi:hypothetical protein